MEANLSAYILNKPYLDFQSKKKKKPLCSIVAIE